MCCVKLCLQQVQFARNSLQQSETNRVQSADWTIEANQRTQTKNSPGKRAFTLIYQ